MTKKHIKCPTCGKPCAWSAENPARPFCSDRCKLIDLGEWANEKYTIPLDPNSSENNLPADDDQE